MYKEDSSTWCFHITSILANRIDSYCIACSYSGVGVCDGCFFFLIHQEQILLIVDAEISLSENCELIKLSYSYTWHTDSDSSVDTFK